MLYQRISCSHRIV